MIFGVQLKRRKISKVPTVSIKLCKLTSDFVSAYSYKNLLVNSLVPGKQISHVHKQLLKLSNAVTVPRLTGKCFLITFLYGPPHKKPNKNKQISGALLFSLHI